MAMAIGKPSAKTVEEMRMVALHGHLRKALQIAELLNPEKVDVAALRMLRADLPRMIDRARDVARGSGLYLK